MKELTPPNCLTLALPAALRAAAALVLGAISSTACGATFQGIGTLSPGLPSYVSEMAPTGGLVLAYTDLSSLGQNPYQGFLRTLDGIVSEFADPIDTFADDGSVLAGVRETAPLVQDCFRWTAASGWVKLGRPAGATEVALRDMAPDGSVLVGEAWNGWDSLGVFRWKQDTGMVLLGVAFTARMKISDDGHVIAGSLPVAGSVVAYTWTEAEGLTDLGAGPGTQITHVSADGSVIVGSRDGEVAEAFRWTAETGAVTLGNLQHPASSHDGSVVAGVLNGRAGAWTPEDGAFGLGMLPGHTGSRAHAASDAHPLVGSRIVGHSQPDDDAGTRAILWDRAHGLRDLKSVLEQDNGLDLTGWTLTEAVAISRDGGIIAGNGLNPDGIEEGWVATLSLQNPSLPLLAIQLAGETIRLRVSGEPGSVWNLQRSPDLGAWQTVRSLTLEAASQDFEVVPPPGGRGFWRLASP